MNASTLILDAQQEGVEITLTPAGKIHLEGGQARREKWAGIVKAHRDEVVEALKAASAPSGTSVHWRWLIHFADKEPVEVSFSPEVTHAEVLALYPAAVAAEPVQGFGQSASPMTADEEQAIRDWLESIGEDDSRIIDETIERCRRDAGARAYFLGRATAQAEPFGREAESIAWADDDRRRCIHCLNLLPGDACKVAEPGGLVPARRGYRPNQEWLQRCQGYLPCANDPDRRMGAERWP
jgi:hypothetical protein